MDLSSTKQLLRSVKFERLWKLNIDRNQLPWRSYTIVNLEPSCELRFCLALTFDLKMKAKSLSRILPNYGDFGLEDCVVMKKYWSNQKTGWNKNKLNLALSDERNTSPWIFLLPDAINHSVLYYQHTQLSSTSSALNLIKTN